MFSYSTTKEDKKTSNSSSDNEIVVSDRDPQSPKPLSDNKDNKDKDKDNKEIQTVDKKSQIEESDVEYESEEESDEETVIKKNILSFVSNDDFKDPGEDKTNDLFVICVDFIPIGYVKNEDEAEKYVWKIARRICAQLIDPKESLYLTEREDKSVDIVSFYKWSIIQCSRNLHHIFYSEIGKFKNLD